MIKELLVAKAKITLLAKVNFGSASVVIKGSVGKKAQ